MPIMPIGKYKGKDISDVPADYLRWMEKQSGLSEWLSGIIKSEVDRRMGAPSRSIVPPAVQARVDSGKKSDSAHFEKLMKEQRAFTFELELLVDNRVMLEDILNRGERDRLASGQGNESVKRLCLATKRVLGIEKLDLSV
jgi:hypothetical protein